MKVKIYYQDFELNAYKFNKMDLVFKPEYSYFIIEMDLGKNAEEWGYSDEQIKEEVAEEVWKIFNLFPEEYKNKIDFDDNYLKDKFKAVKHTSMSIGDYIQFEDGEVWIAAACGWKIRR